VNSSPKPPSAISSVAKQEVSSSDAEQEAQYPEEEKGGLRIDPDLLLDDDEDYYRARMAGMESDEEDEDDGGIGVSGTSEERKMLEQNQESWSMLKHSLEMDNEDLLLNMLYFSDDGAGALEDSSSIGKVLDGAMTETFALHSENNTPYKLKPVSQDELDKLKPETLDESFSAQMGQGGRGGAQQQQQRQQYVDDAKARSESESAAGPESKGCGVECVVCKEELELGTSVLKLPHCGHTFHEECVSKWFKHQDWCPICRTSVSGKKKGVDDEEGGGKTRNKSLPAVAGAALDDQQLPLSVTTATATASTGTAAAGGASK
jgi:hypothetical protein